MTDIEVARYALRTFKIEGDAIRSIAVHGDYWHDGVCEAVCLANNFEAMTGQAPAVGSVWVIWTPGGGRSATFATACGSVAPLHSSPHKECHCGIYGSLSVSHLVSQYRAESNKMIAVIAAEGKTIIGPRGLRTERARVVAYTFRGGTNSRDLRQTIQTRAGLRHCS